MKLMHLSDLHVGKRVNEFPMLEDQKHIFSEILSAAFSHKADGVIIAGDLYDKSVPSAEAVDAFDDFLTTLSRAGVALYLISGNHDSPERLDFGSRIMQKHNVHIAGAYHGVIPKITVADEFGPVNLFLMPYLKPSVVNRLLGLQTASFDECVRAVLDQTPVDTRERNILAAHQFVTAGGKGPVPSDSESRSLGGTDNVDVSAFDAFDYVALGHIHGPQKIGRETVRYCGSPLKYSFSECSHKKGAPVITLREKGVIEIESVPLAPRRDMRKIRCRLGELASQAGDRQDYVHITLTDEDEIVDAIGKARAVFPNVMLLDFDNKRSSAAAPGMLRGEDLREKTPRELFSLFYQAQNHIPLSPLQEALLGDALKKLGGAL